MNPKLREKISESLSAVLPITLIVLAISVLFVPLEISAVAMFLVGAILLIVGMGLFQLGAEIAMTPLGEGIGRSIAHSKRMPPVVILSLIIGIVITIAEPDLQVLAEQVPAIPNMVLILVVAVGSKHLITADMLKPGAVVIDAGINRVDGVLYGDVDTESAMDVVSLITPVPGGVGPMTIAMLLENTLEACERHG